MKSRLSEELIKAVYSGNIATVEVFAKSNHLNDVDVDKRTALFHAVLSGSGRLASLLIGHGTDINLQDKLGWTPLHYAVQNHDLPIIKLLIEHKVDLKKEDNYGNTALFRAVFESKGRGDVIKILIANGADIHNENKSGMSPLKLANTIANYDVKQYF